jgi:hypothetical protein
MRRCWLEDWLVSGDGLGVELRCPQLTGVIFLEILGSEVEWSEKHFFWPNDWPVGARVEVLTWELMSDPLDEVQGETEGWQLLYTDTSVRKL